MLAFLWVAGGLSIHVAFALLVVVLLLLLDWLA